MTASDPAAAPAPVPTAPDGAAAQPTPRVNPGANAWEQSPSDRRTPVRRAPPDAADKARRALWGAVRFLLFAPSPTPLHGLRRGLLRLFGARVGLRVAVYPSVRIFAPWRLRLDDGATVGPGATLYSVAPIALGPRAVVSQGAHLCSASHDHTAADFALVAAPITLEADAWVAAEAFVGPGVTIGEGAVVAARAVAVRSVPARTVVAGNPARPVGRRPAGVRNILPGRVDDGDAAS